MFRIFDMLVRMGDETDLNDVQVAIGEHLASMQPVERMMLVLDIEKFILKRISSSRAFREDQHRRRR